MKRLIVKWVCAILMLITSNISFGQTHEMGVTGGTTFYMGDLNPSTPFKQPYPAVGLIYRYNLDYYFVMRGTLLYGKVGANDADAANPWQRMRNLRFTSDIAEAAFAMEFNFLPYEPGNHKKMFFSPYVFAGVGGFYFNPQATYKGRVYDLVDLGTEGQTVIPGKKTYSNFHVAFPFGIGFKYNPFKGFTMSLEWGMRGTLTDYMDDVSGRYADPALLAAAGKATVELADQSIGVMGNNVGRQRGQESTKDWYSYLGLNFCFRIKDKVGNCWRFRSRWYTFPSLSKKKYS